MRGFPHFAAKDNQQFETIILAIQTDFALRYHQERFQAVVDSWMELVPNMTHRIMQVFESDLLQEMKGQHWPSEQVLIKLAQLVD